MCSTHNPKKHYFATRQKVCIRFTFVNEDSMSRSFMIDIAQFQEQGSLAIAKAILYLETKGFNVQKYEIYLPQLENMSLNLQRNPLISFEKLPKKQLFIHLSKKHTQQISQQEYKKNKQSERNISQVIEKVKYWRGLFEDNKMTLKDAAVIVAIPKKSLDDYFLLLRQAEILGFEFDKNLNKKMGQLRSFHKKHSKKLPGGKLPLQLGKLKCYNLVPDFQATHIAPIKNNVKDNPFNFKELRHNLQTNHIDLDDDCDYACNMGQDSD